MPDKSYPPAAFQFVVRFDPSSGINDASFQEVGGISSELATKGYREGGENRFEHLLPEGVKNQRLTLKRGLAAADSGLVRWCQAVLEGGLGKRIQPRMVAVFLLDHAGLPLRTWAFENAYPIKWSVAEFRSDKNEVALETVELSYTVVKRGL